MPPLGLSAGVRKARELGRRTVSLALARPRMVEPTAQYAPRPCDGILVLQRGENASTDYYLRPRLEACSTPVEIVDLESSPAACQLLDDAQALFVVVCRYASHAWLDALEADRARLARVAFFMDDDLPAMMRDASLPQSARGKVALHFASHADRLSAIAGEVWVSSPVLAGRYPAARPQVLDPLPDAEFHEPSAGAPWRVVYHGTDVHGAERRFVAEVARLLQADGSQARFEITGDAALGRACAGLPNVTVAPQQAWPAYRAKQNLSQAAVSLAPLFPTAVNEARAPVKAFDAARLGAAGLYADAAPYRRFVRDGVDGMLLPMQPGAWAAAIDDLLRRPEQRLALARQAHERFAALRRTGASLPPPPGA